MTGIFFFAHSFGGFLAIFPTVEYIIILWFVYILLRKVENMEIPRG